MIFLCPPQEPVDAVDGDAASKPKVTISLDNLQQDGAASNGKNTNSSYHRG